MKDWAKLSVCTCRCRCGTTFRAKHQIDFDKRISIVDPPCPSCGSAFNGWNASYDPEKWTLE